MDQRNKEIYHNLMKLCGEIDSPFFFKDFEFDEYIYRIFNYRLASYTDFCKPDALLARGIMFNMDGDEPDELVCRPMPKFFNYEENPFTMGLESSRIVSFMTKEDGSLISAYGHFRGDEFKLAFKSKGSLFSDQVAMAKEFFSMPENIEFAKSLYYAVANDWTVNMELTSPNNRIVLPYSSTSLKVLNAVNNLTGEIIFREDIDNTDLDMIDEEHWVKSEYVAPAEHDNFVNSIDEMTGIEGYVLRYSYPDMGRHLVKKKTKWYVTLHHTKDSITIPRRLFECIINEATDDLRSMFHDDQQAIDKIIDMETKVIPQFNHFCSIPEKFYAENKELSRKDYAIKGTKELGDFFPLAMGKYLVEQGTYRPINMKEWAIKNYKMFGIKEEELKVDAE